MRSVIGVVEVHCPTCNAQELEPCGFCASLDHGIEGFGSAAGYDGVPGADLFGFPEAWHRERVMLAIGRRSARADRGAS